MHLPTAGIVASIITTSDGKNTLALFMLILLLLRHIMYSGVARGWQSVALATPI